MVYTDGLVSLFAFGGIYAAGTFGWNTIQIGTFGIMLAIAGAFGAWIGGKLDDRLGPKRVIAGALIILLLSVIWILTVDRDHVPVRCRSRHRCRAAACSPRPPKRSTFCSDA